MSKPTNPKLIGAFVLGALVLVTGAVIVLGGGKFFQRSIPVVMFFDGSVSGLSPGSPVNFRGVRVGTVSSVFVRYQPDNTAEPLRIPVFAEIVGSNVRVAGPKDEREEVREGSGANIAKMVEQGLRAQLAIPSLVTGQATVSLDFFPGTPMQAVDLYTDRLQIPTVPSTLQEVQTTLEKIYNQLSNLPLSDLMDDARSVLKGASKLVNDPQIQQAVANANLALADLQQTSRMLDTRLTPLVASLQTTSDAATGTLREAQRAIQRTDARTDQVLAQASETMESLRTSLATADKVMQSVNKTIAPNSPISFELVNALRDAASAARALRDLADQLQRNPNSLLFGRPPSARSGGQ